MVLCKLNPRRGRNRLLARPSFADPFGMGLGMGSLFDEFLNGFDKGNLSEFTPRIDIIEDEKSLTVKCELAGLEEKDISVSLEDESIVIEGEKKFENEENENGYRHIERSYGSFKRAVPLRNEINPESIKADFKNGLLTIKMQKMVEKEEPARKIEINAG